MDKKTIIGLVIIGLILSVFTIVNQPSDKELKQQQEEVAMQEMKKKEADNAKKKATVIENKMSDVVNPLRPKNDANGKQLSTDKGLVFVNSVTKEDTVIAESKVKNQLATAADKGELIRLQNEKLIIDFSTKGGKVAAVYLKEFESYNDYAKKTKKQKKDKNEKITPLLLFSDGDAVNELVFPLNGKKIKTGNYIFTVKTKRKIQLLLNWI